MKDVLKGKTILIGKEPGQGRLLIAIKGLPKVTAIGQIGSVANSVSRCKPAEGVAHCQLEIDQAGNLTLTNLKAQNVTFVNNTEIMSKRVSTTSTVSLGKDRYPIDLGAIVDAAAKFFDDGVSIKHLKKVWDEYSENLKKIKIRQKNVGLLQSIPMTFTLLGGLVAVVAPEIHSIAWVFTGIALVILFIGLYLRFTDKSIEKTEQEQEKFQNKYVCPKCHHFLGNQPYNILKQNKGCPHCKCLWKTEE